MTAIDVRDLGVRYGRRVALEGVSLAVREGEVCAVLGRNGAGKSSLVRCLLGQQRASAGAVRLLGCDPWRYRALLMARIGVVPEVPDAPPGLTARDLAKLLGRIHRRWDAGAVGERLERFDVPQDVPFGRLSRGQKAHVQLALALGHGPELLVLDDPTLGLDALARRALLDELIGELADRGVTVFLTTHDLAGVERIADRVAILRTGRLLLVEEMDALKGRFRRIALPRERAAAGAARLDALGPVSVVRHGWGAEAVVSSFDPERLADLDDADYEATALTLEEIFVALHDTPGAHQGAKAWAPGPEVHP